MRGSTQDEENQKVSLLSASIINEATPIRIWQRERHLHSFPALLVGKIPKKAIFNLTMAPRSLLISVLALSASNAAAFAPQTASPRQLAVPGDVASRNALFASYLESMGGTATAPTKSFAPSKWSPSGNSAPVVQNPVTIVPEPETAAPANSYSADSWSPSGPSPLAPEGPVTAAATPPKTSYAPSRWSPSGASASTFSEPAAQPQPVTPAPVAQAPKKSYAPSGWKPSGGFASVPESTAAPVEYSAPAPVEAAPVESAAPAASAPKSNWSVSKWSPTGKSADASTSAFNSLLGAAEAAAPVANAAAAPKSNWSVSKWSPSGGASGPTTMASLNDFSAPAAAAPAPESGSVATAVAEPAAAEAAPASLEDLAKERAEIMESASLSDVKEASAEPSDRVSGEKLKVVKARRKVGKSNTEASEGRRGVLIAGLGAMFAAAAGLKSAAKPESPGYEFLRKMSLAGVSEEGATSFADRFLNRQSQFKVPPIEKRAVPERRVLGKVTTEEGKPIGGRVLPKEELSSDTLNYIKNYQKTL